MAILQDRSATPLTLDETIKLRIRGSAGTLPGVSLKSERVNLPATSAVTILVRVAGYMVFVGFQKIAPKATYHHWLGEEA